MNNACKKRSFRSAICLVWLVFLLFASGCSEKLMALKRYGESQDQMQLYVERQEKLFLKLKEDIEKNALSVGLSQDEVFSLYGDPVFCSQDSGVSRCLFRHPTKYFSVEKVYLVFDESRSLLSWEFVPLP